MKRIAWFLCAALAASTLAGCDDKTGGDDPTPPPATGKLISTMTTTVAGEGTETLALVYDAQKRPTQIGDNVITYAENSFSVVADLLDDPQEEYKEEYVYTLSNNRATSVESTYTELPDFVEHMAYAYKYDGAKLAGFEYTKPQKRTLVFAWDGQTISQISAAENNYTVKFDYGEVKNNMNLDLFGVIYQVFIDDIDYAWALGYTGDRCSLLPEKITGSDGATITLKYTADTEGYITQIDLEETEDGITDKATMKFTYK